MTSIRAKFQCIAVNETLHWTDKSKHLYTAEFSVVSAGSEDNDKYFEATPSGTIKLGTFKEDYFEIGKEYYVDFTKAED